MGRVTFLVGILLCSDVLAQTVTLTVPVQETAPHKFLIGTGPARGICPDVMRAITAIDRGLSFSIDYAHPLTIRRIEMSLKTGTADAACALLDTPERRNVAAQITTPLYVVRQKVAVRADYKTSVKNMADLIRENAGSLIITTAGSPYGAELRKHGLGVDDSTGDNQLNLRKLLKGRGNFFYQGEHTLLRIIEAEGQGEHVRILPVVFKEEPIYFWVSKKQPAEVGKRLNDALTTLSASGELKRIVDSYHVP